MRKPTEPEKPYEPYPRYLSPQVREQVGPVDDDDFDEPSYPTITIEFIEKWATKNGVDPKTVKVDLYPGSHEYEMCLETTRTITDEMRQEVEVEHTAALKEYNEVTLPAYEAAKVQYDVDLRAYYKWKHDSI